MAKVVLFWLRRDLRLDDNAGLYHALKNHPHVLPLFIFDSDILEKLDDPTDARLNFIYQTVIALKKELQHKDSDLIIRHGKPLEVFYKLAKQFEIEAIYTNNDYEPYARKRDATVEAWAQKQGIKFKSFKDQCLFEKEEILTDAGKPYTVYTPYKNKVLKTLNAFYLKSYPTKKYFKSFLKIKSEKAPTLEDLGFKKTDIELPASNISTKTLDNYAKNRDYPAMAHGTTRIGMHLRFGTVSVRALARLGQKHSAVWLSELIWRDFFMQILWHYPHVEKASFRPEYDKIQWRKSKSDFKKWSEGKTGVPLVDAGMRELNTTGFMHNRVRMVVASYLCKNLLIYWYEGERYFAKKLLDYDLAANNGNWQWAAGSGCDAAPYFRIFNPETQSKKFDSEQKYIKKWVPELDTEDYPEPMIDPQESRGRCLAAYHKALKK